MTLSNVKYVCFIIGNDGKYVLEQGKGSVYKYTHGISNTIHFERKDKQYEVRVKNSVHFKKDRFTQ